MARRRSLFGAILGAALLVGLSTTGRASAAAFVVKNTNDGSTVAACWLGLDLGAVAAGNQTALLIKGGSNANVVGGTSSADRNVISTNEVGVHVDGTTGNVVEGNYVGTAPSGRTKAGNGA